MLKEFVDTLLKKYTEDVCDNCGNTTNPYDISLDVKAVQNEERVVGQVWYECDRCSDIQDLDIFSDATEGGLK